MLPNCIIVGGMKCGTSALRDYLNMHHDVFMANQEIHFFSSNENFSKGADWYKEFFKDWNGEKIIGEKTPAYLVYNAAPTRISRLIPDIKLIFLFRNPVDRAYSHYWHEVRAARETLSFERALQREKVSTSDSSRTYLDTGKYIDHLKRFTDVFSRSQMLFLLSENLKEDTNAVLEQVLQFLDVNSNFDFGKLKKRHVGGIPCSRFLSKLAFDTPIKRVTVVREFIHRVINTKKGVFPEMRSQTREHLQDFFAEYNKKLAEFTGLDLKVWDI